MKFVMVIMSIMFQLTMLLHTPFALAAVPNTLSYQGTLTDKSGNPITATKTIDFKLYNVADSGTALWSETQTVTVASGRFGVVLGVVTPFDKSILTGNTWIGITVQGETELIPRQKLTSVAYALVAETVADPTALTPSGMVSAYAGSIAPAGWLLCDGSQISRTTYSKLFSVIDTSHGIGDGATTFHLPDYRGRFLRGVDGTAVNDPDKTNRTALNIGGNTGNSVGSVQNEEYKSHNHAQRDSGGGSELGIMYYNLYSGSMRSYSNQNNIGSLTTAFSGGSETRPKNVNVNWIIKY